MRLYQGIRSLILTLFRKILFIWVRTDVSGNATGDVFQRFGSIMLFDLSASLALNEHVTLRAGAENIFNTYPDEATNQAVRGLIYSRNAPYDTDGGQYYVRLGITF